jgi:ABC-type transport system involved in multi-copper enzyme maturation permease subunit
MNPASYSLLWKEWREHRRKLAALAAALVLVPAVASLRRPELFFGVVSLEFFIAIPLASMFVAMNLAAGEETRGTLRFLQALPIEMSRPARAKLLCGAVTVVAPALAAVAAAWLWSWLIDSGEVAAAISEDLSTFQTSWLIDNWFVARAVGGSLAAVSILLWMAAMGVNRSDEVRAAAVGLLAVVGVWAWLMVLHMIWAAESTPYWWNVLTAGAAGGPALSAPGDVALEAARAHGPLAALWPFAAVALASHAALAAWYVRRFGRKARSGVVRPESLPVVVEKSWLAPPRRSPATAIVWKQARTSAPFALAIAGAILVTALTFACYAAWRGYGDALEVLVASSLTAWAIVGMFVAIVAGIAVFIDDLEPRLHTFWRSRAVSVDQWFVLKFFTGLLIPMLILPLPALTSVAVYVAAGERLPADMIEGVSQGGVYLLLQIGLYATAVLAITLLRQAVYAAIGTIAAVGLFLALLQVIWPAMSIGGAAAAGMCAAAAAAALAWAALRNDWGWNL